MTKEEIASLTDDELQKKEKNTKVLAGIFIPIILGLMYYGIRDYFNGETNTPLTIITICTIGGLASLLPSLKTLRAEIKNRNL